MRKVMASLVLSFALVETGVAYQEKAILTNLGITHISLLSKGLYFSIPETVWGFEEKVGFSQFLERLKKQSEPFTQIEVWGSQFLLLGEWDNQHLQLWVKRHSDEHFSGTLSIWGLDNVAPSIAALEDLPANTRVLLDMSTDHPMKSRQWIYILPLTPEETLPWLRQLLVRQKWQQQPVNGALEIWQKGDERLHYHLSTQEEKTVMYLLRQTIQGKH